MAKNLVGKVCVRGYKIEVLRSAAGYYLGTRYESGCPMCRISDGYAKTRELAIENLEGDRVCEENMFCNGYKGCFLGGVNYVDRQTNWNRY